MINSPQKEVDRKPGLYDPLNGLNRLVKSEDFKQEPLESDAIKNDITRSNNPTSSKEDSGCNIKNENGVIKSEANDHQIQV